MADNGAHGVAEGVANLHLDDVTGERVSKSELKRRQKLRAQEEKKQQRAAAASPNTERKRPAEDDESSLAPNVRRTRDCSFRLIDISFYSNISRLGATGLRDYGRARGPIPILINSKPMPTSETSSRRMPQSRPVNMKRIQRFALQAGCTPSERPDRSWYSTIFGPRASRCR
jgi:hypothetical protein